MKETDMGSFIEKKDWIFCVKTILKTHTDIIKLEVSRAYTK